MIRYLLPLGVFIALVVLLGVGLTLNPREVPSPLIGKSAPEFSLAQLRFPDQALTRASMAGAPALVNYWATWCVGCREEHPLLMRIANQGGVALYGVNYKDDRQQALAWLSTHGDPYTASGMDPEGATGIDFGVYGLPETFVLDAQGRIAYKHIGPLTEKAWNEQMLPVLQRLSGG